MELVGKGNKMWTKTASLCILHGVWWSGVKRLDPRKTHGSNDKEIAAARKHYSIVDEMQGFLLPLEVTLVCSEDPAGHWPPRTRKTSDLYLEATVGEIHK